MGQDKALNINFEETGLFKNGHLVFDLEHSSSTSLYASGYFFLCKAWHKICRNECLITY
jgi:hypothetical protein